jgi:hypothetical protein
MDVVGRGLNCVVPGTRCHLLRIPQVREPKEPDQTAYEIGARVQIVSRPPDHFWQLTHPGSRPALRIVTGPIITR